MHDRAAHLHFKSRSQACQPALQSFSKGINRGRPPRTLSCLHAITPRFVALSLEQRTHNGSSGQFRASFGAPYFLSASIGEGQLWQVFSSASMGIRLMLTLIQVPGGVDPVMVQLQLLSRMTWL